MSRRPRACAPGPVAVVVIVAALVAVALLAGCTSGNGTSGSGTSGSGPGATGSPTGTTGGTAVPKTPPPTVAPDPLAVYQGLVAQWQAARTAFLGLVTSGRRLSLAAEHAAAAAFLAAERRFAAAMAPANWPIRAASAIVALRRISGQMQSHLVAMTRAGSGSAFTGRLADYSTDVARDEAAIRAVEAALGG